MATNTTATIVNLNTVVTSASEPSQLQQSGIVVSTGGTTLTAGTLSPFIANASALAAIQQPAVALESLSWAGGTVTATASVALGLATGETFTVIIAGATPAGYNGTYTATVTGADTFTFALATNPGTETAPGTYTVPSAAHLIDANTTFWAQGSQVGYYVLELGPQASNEAAITALQTWITNNDTGPQEYYAYLLPASWDKDESAAVNTLASNFSSATGLRYFFINTTSGTIAAYTNKAVFATVPSPTQAASEMVSAALFYQWLANNPSATNILAPMAYRYLYGVTPWVQKGNSSAINAVLSANGNLALTGSEGGISNTILFKGTLMSGVQASAWYGIDWVQVQAKQALAAAIINGSNQQPPLLYNQAGINSLLAVAQKVAASAISFGCAATATVTATSYADYIAANPDDYAAGVYNGLSCTMTSQNGFLSITFNLDAVQFAS